MGETKPKAKASGMLMRKHAYGELKARILSGEMPPGTFLSERQVGGWLGMSKTPVRAAFERLETEGFISISPQQGVVVRDLSVADIADHFELRVALETYVVGRLAGRIKPTQKTQLQANLAAQKIAITKGNVDELIKLDGAMHLLICEFLENKEMMRVMLQLRDRIMRFIQHSFTCDDERMYNVLDEHEALVHAIISGKTELAVKLMTEHLENGKQTILGPKRN